MAKLLDRIVAIKEKELSEKRGLYPIALLERSIYFKAPPVSLKRYLSRPDKVGVIAEIKRRSPSRGVMNAALSVQDISIGYMQSGASALSVLTDKEFFGGSNEDLTVARRSNFCPIVRKDFVLDEYQVIEARSIGADVVLLIARILDKEKLKELSAVAKKIGLEVLIEVHSENELDAALAAEPDILGVNNRDLDTLTVDVAQSHRLGAKIPSSLLKISESGLDKPEAIIGLKKVGFSGFLIGEAFMRSADPIEACRKLVMAVQSQTVG